MRVSSTKAALAKRAVSISLIAYITAGIVSSDSINLPIDVLSDGQWSLSVIVRDAHHRLVMIHSCAWR
jgi:hypothetical protein